MRINHVFFFLVFTFSLYFCSSHVLGQSGVYPNGLLYDKLDGSRGQSDGATSNTVNHFPRIGIGFGVHQETKLSSDQIRIDPGLAWFLSVGVPIGQDYDWYIEYLIYKWNGKEKIHGTMLNDWGTMFDVKMHILNCRSVVRPAIQLGIINTGAIAIPLFMNNGFEFGIAFDLKFTEDITLTLDARQLFPFFMSDIQEESGRYFPLLIHSSMNYQF